MRVDKAKCLQRATTRRGTAEGGVWSPELEPQQKVQCPFIPVDSEHVEKGLGAPGSSSYFQKNTNLDLQVNCPSDILITLKNTVSTKHAKEFMYFLFLFKGKCVCVHVCMHAHAWMLIVIC